MKAGIYHTRYNKNTFDSSKNENGQDNFNGIENRDNNLYRLNLPLKDRNYEMPSHSVTNEDLMNNMSNSPSKP